MSTAKAIAKSKLAKQLQDNELLDEILVGISESVLTQLENTEISLDEKMKIRLFDYYQITKLVKKQIKLFVERGEFAEAQMDNIIKFEKMKNHNP